MATGVLGKSDSILGQMILGSDVESVIDTLSVFDTITLSETIASSNIFNLSVADTVTFSESIGRHGTTEEFVTDTIVLNESITKNQSISYSVSDSLDFGDSAEIIVNQQIYNKGVADTVVFSESISLNKILHLAVSDTIIFTETFSPNNDLSVSVSDTIVFTETLFESVSKGVYDTIDLAEDISPEFAYNRSRSDKLTITESIGLAKLRGFGAYDFIEIDEYITVQKAQSFGVSDTITFDESIYGETTLESVNDALIITETITFKKVHYLSVADTLVINESIGKNGTIYNLSVSDQINIIEGKDKIVGANSIFINGIQVTKLQTHNLVILQASDLSMTLPAPEFNDQEANQGELKILRSKTGVRRLYKHSNDKYKLTYEFVINKLKAFELRNFIMTENTNYFTMTNWKGEIWYCNFVSNPFTFNEEAYWEGNCGNKFRITLEFEGVRIH